MRKALMILLPVLVIALGGFGAYTMIMAREEPPKRPVEALPPLVEVARVMPESRRLTVRAEGTVRPRTESELVPEVSGRVMWVSPSLANGAFFDEGDVVVKLDAREYELAVVRSRAAVAQARLRLATEEQEADLARREWEALGEGEPSALTLREPQTAEARASLASAEAALQQAEYDLERTVIKAPFAGRVREKKIDVGQFVSRGTSIARIYAVDFAEVRLPIADSELAFINLPLAYRGAESAPTAPKVTLRAEFGGAEHTWEGRIVRTEGEIDPRTRMIHTIAQVADPYGPGKRPGRPPLAVGMFVEAEIEGKAVSNVVVLPRSVVRGENSVLVVDEEGRLRFRQVEILRSTPEEVIIRSGLTTGDRVCTSVLEAAVDGMEVRVRQPEAAGEAADS